MTVASFGDPQRPVEVSGEIRAEEPRDGFVTWGVLLAQLNVGRILAPIDSPVMAQFVARIADVNRQAETAPGFVWRLQDDEGEGALDQRIFNDDTLLVNMSVWRDAASLFDFVYRNLQHREALQQRRQWFSAVAEPMVVCWWTPDTHMPTIRDAEERLTHVRENGPSARAFPFRRVIPDEYQFLEP